MRLFIREESIKNTKPLRLSLTIWTHVSNPSFWYSYFTQNNMYEVLVVIILVLFLARFYFFWWIRRTDDEITKSFTETPKLGEYWRMSLTAQGMIPPDMDRSQILRVVGFMSYNLSHLTCDLRRDLSSQYTNPFLNKDQIRRLGKTNIRLGGLLQKLELLLKCKNVILVCRYSIPRKQQFYQYSSVDSCEHVWIYKRMLSLFKLLQLSCNYHQHVLDGIMIMLILGQDHFLSLVDCMFPFHSMTTEMIMFSCGVDMLDLRKALDISEKEDRVIGGSIGYSLGSRDNDIKVQSIVEVRKLFDDLPKRKNNI